MSSLKPLDQYSQVSHGAFCRGVLSICSNGSALLNKMAVMSIYGKTFKSGIKHRRRKVYQIYSNDDHRMTFDIFLQDAVAILEECYIAFAYKHCFIQVSESWPMCLLFSLKFQAPKYDVLTR